MILKTNNTYNRKVRRKMMKSKKVLEIKRNLSLTDWMSVIKENITEGNINSKSYIEEMQKLQYEVIAFKESKYRENLENLYSAEKVANEMTKFIESQKFWPKSEFKNLENV